MLLETVDLRLMAGGAEVLHGISIQVDQGAVVSVIGPNGAGKSCLLGGISGLLTPASGEILFDNKRIDGLSPMEIVKRGMSHVPEGRAVFPDLSVQENLEIGAYLRKDRSEISADLKRMFELFPILQERRKLSAGKLSGGEQQMLAVGRSLMSRPKLMLLDEPTLGLSPLVRASMAELVLRLQSTGVTVLLVEQSAAMALRVSQKAYVLELGRIVLQGEAEKLMQDERVKKAYLSVT